MHFLDTLFNVPARTCLSRLVPKKQFDQDSKWCEIHLIWRTSVRCVGNIYHGTLPDGGATQRINISSLPQHDYKFNMNSCVKKLLAG